MILYNTFVNRVPGIRERYQQSRNKNSGKRKIFSWLYLLRLNVEYHVLGHKVVGESMVLNPDKGKIVLEEAESLKTSGLSPEELAEKLSCFDIISFDVFDTLILRNLSRPEDVFFLIQNKLEYPNFKALRKNAEWKSREKRFQQEGDYEVDLRDIWTEISSITGIDVDSGMKAEYDAENESCYANPYFLKVILYLKKYNKKMIVCSDMYLGKELIKKLLEDCGYPEFDGYYISCDYHQSKHNGNLYKIIKKDFGRNMSYIQVGDNEFSDIRQAEKKGFDTYFYPNVHFAGMSYRAQDMDPIISSVYSGIVNPYLHNGLTKENPEFEFGFIYGGLFVTGYCQFIHEYVRNHNIEKILFLARDGEILEKVYKYLYPEEACLCRYTYWSRLASTKLSAPVLKAHFIERMVIHKIDQKYTLRSIFETMDLEDMFALFKSECLPNDYSENRYLDKATADDLQTFLNIHWAEVCEHYEDEIQEGKRYFERLLEGANKVVAVDVGWVGSGAITLSMIAKKIWNFDCDITGILAGTCSGNNPDYEATAMELSEGKLISYMFSPHMNRDIWKQHDAVKGHNMLVELLLSSTQKSFRGFKKDRNGSYEFSEYSEKINAAEIQRGILTFAELYKNHPLGKLMISGRDAVAPIALLYENQKYVDRLLRKSGIKANIE